MKHRGLTFVTVLIVLALAGGVYWLLTYGSAYYEDFEVKHILSQAANLCYRETEDEKVKDYVFNQLHTAFDTNVESHGRVERVLAIDVNRDDLRIQRSEIPKKVDIWITYSRTVTVPFLGQQRQVTFVDHAEQDLSPVKW